MEINTVNGVKLRIKAEKYPEVIGVLLQSNDGELREIAEEFAVINPIDNELWLDTNKMQAKDVMYLYTMGLKSAEIADIRHVSRQNESNKLNTELESIESENPLYLVSVHETHLANRRILQEIITKYYVYICTKEKNISKLSEILGTKYKTERSVYKAFIKLGGNPDIIPLDTVDNRFKKVSDDKEVIKIFGLFADGKSNREVAEEVGMHMTKVYALRKKYHKFLNI